MTRLERDDAPARVAVAHEELHALAGGVAQRSKRGSGEIGEGEGRLGRPSEGDEAESEAEPTSIVAAHQVERFEVHGQAVSRGTGEAGDLLEAGEIERADRQHLEDVDGLVNRAGCAYTVHEREPYLNE